MLTVYGRPNSSNSAKVFWLLEELGTEYELVKTGQGFGRADTPEFLAMNPFGKVPVICDDDTVVWESNAVLRYLASRYGPTPLWPQDPTERSRVDRWMDWISISLVPPLTRLRKARAAGRSGDNDLPNVIAAFTAMDAWLTNHTYLARESLSLADIVAAAAVYRWSLLPEGRFGFPGLVAYTARLAERPGYHHHIRDPLN